VAVADRDAPLVKTRSVRCAIYTRKSTEEGLEQEFNSLMAQREAAEAYILSQRSQGWIVLPEQYDDGGFSGGNMDRPALRRLLEDIERGRIDCVVVYKVDRLSRTLLDFARIIGVFDTRAVSFVSVTQQFNTSAPLGRLTLNILLSFAQFERDIIGERTRDKIQASRRKGHWTGRLLPLGYDLNPVTRQLEVNEAEAEHVREIFRLYAEKKSLIATVAEINARGWQTKSWTTQKGRFRQGGPFRWPTLRALLTNVLYAGLIRHNKEPVPAQHPAIVELDLFHRVAEQLQAQEPGTATVVRQSQDALLTGLLFCCGCGSRMIVTYAKRPYGRIRYYVCGSRHLKRERLCAARAVAADRIEHLVVERVRELRDDAAIADVTIGPTYLQSIFTRIAYDSRKGQLSVTLREHGPATNAGVKEAPGCVPMC
jgi:site-specific DNA recombinase